MISKAASLRARVQGFTLIELMVAIAVLCVLLVLAAPSFFNFRKNVELTSTINNLSASLSTARAEAMRTNSAVTVVPGSSWASGWTVTRRSDNTVVESYYTGGISQFLTFVTPTATSPSTAPAALPVTGVRFNGEGYAQSADGTTSLSGCLQFSNGLRQRQLRLELTGQVRICDPTASAGTNGACG